MHIFVRTLCLILFVAQHSVIPFMSLFFKYLGLSPLDSGIIRSCQSWLPVVGNFIISLIKNCNNFFPKRRTIIYLLIFINVGVHTCLIFIPPSAPYDIMHCFGGLTKNDSKYHKVDETTEQIHYIAPSVNPANTNDFVSTTKSIRNRLNHFEDSNIQRVTESHYHTDKSNGRNRGKLQHQINLKSENFYPSHNNDFMTIVKSVPSTLKQLDSTSIQKVLVPLNDNSNSMFQGVSSHLIEHLTRKNDRIKYLSPVDKATQPLTSQQVSNQVEESIVASNKSKELNTYQKTTFVQKQNLNIDHDKFHKNQKSKKIFDSNHVISSKNNMANLFTTHQNNAGNPIDTLNVLSDSTLSVISENVKLEAGQKYQQSADLSVLQKNRDNAQYDIDNLYGPADSFLSVTSERVKLMDGEIYQHLEALTTESTLHTSTNIPKLSAQTERNMLEHIFHNAFFKNQEWNFRPLKTINNPKKISDRSATTQSTVDNYSLDLRNSDNLLSDQKQNVHHKSERNQKYNTKHSVFNTDVMPTATEQDTLFGIRPHNIRARHIVRHATEMSNLSKKSFKSVRTSDNTSFAAHFKKMEGAHDVMSYSKDKSTLNQYNTTFSNLHVTLTFSLTLEFLYFTIFLFTEKMYSLSLMNVLLSHHISFPIWALIVCPIILIGSYLCPCPFQIATHFIVAIGILLIGLLLLICVPVDIIERYTTRKRKNSKPTYKSDNSNHYRLFSSLAVAAIGFLTACNSEFIMWHLEEDNTFYSNYEFIYCGYIVTSFLVHFITIRMWKQYKLVGEVENENEEDEEWEPQSYDLKDVEQSCCHWPRLIGLVCLATQMLLLPFLRPVWLLALVAGILHGLTESFILAMKHSYRAGYGMGCFVAGSIVHAYGTQILFLSASAVTLVFIITLLVSNWLSRFFCRQSHSDKLSAIPNYDSEESEDTKSEEWLERALQEEQYNKAKLHQSSSRLQQSDTQNPVPETTEDWLERAMKEEDYFKAKLQQSGKLKKSVSFH